MRKRYLVLIEKAENSYGAYAPDVPGCISVGKTIEETFSNFQEALDFHFEGMAQDGEPIPPPAYVDARFIDVEIPDKVSSTS
jgi:predicted RNase H-like HicB family nuclease